MKMIFELFIKQKTLFNFVSFLTEQTLLQKVPYLCDFREHSSNLRQDVVTFLLF